MSEGWRWRSALAVGFCAVILLGASMTLAQADGSGTRLEYSERVDIAEFEAPAPSSSAAQVSAPLMVTLAYAAIWLLAAGFMWSIWRRGRGLEHELRAAERRLEALDERLRAELGHSSESEE